MEKSSEKSQEIYSEYFPFAMPKKNYPKGYTSSGSLGYRDTFSKRFDILKAITYV